MSGSDARQREQLIEETMSDLKQKEVVEPHEEEEFRNRIELQEISGADPQKTCFWKPNSLIKSLHLSIPQHLSTQNAYGTITSGVPKRNSIQLHITSPDEETTSKHPISKYRSNLANIIELHNVENAYELTDKKILQGTEENTYCIPKNISFTNKIRYKLSGLIKNITPQTTFFTNNTLVAKKLLAKLFPPYTIAIAIMTLYMIVNSTFTQTLTTLSNQMGFGLFMIVFVNICIMHLLLLHYTITKTLNISGELIKPDCKEI